MAESVRLNDWAATTSQATSLSLVFGQGPSTNHFRPISPARECRHLPFVLGQHQVTSGFEGALAGVKVFGIKDMIFLPEKVYSGSGRRLTAGRAFQFRQLMTIIK